MSTKIFRAIKSNDIEQLELCIKNGGNVKCKLGNKTSLLYAIKKRCNKKVIQLLLQHGAADLR